ncbi:hypothetical protein Gbro_0565 [Gordonia bronchialis DSM 43247]|uniref:Helix-turn-helix domain-containing protein n=3 Tax=Gordonia bronchialis TaxID=2054 RepID=D0LEH7_GORB4|nr:hypothetical protein Gbro_0565 [Gordonia bronchialis DSM 43247]QGS26238.1 excisionase family DNA-binding protein [Gordonia bronchialis]STQ62672.1 DNA binding domain, excisionase family [Gordonia bronchialis]
MAKTAGYLTVSEYAALMRISKWAVYDRIRAGLIPGVHQIAKGATYRIPRAAVPAEAGADSPAAPAA